MNSVFFEYFFNEEEINNLVKNALIVLDTNALLNIYRYNNENRKKYFELLESERERLFLTHQSCKEFFRNRLIVINNKLNFKESLKKELLDELERISNITEDSNFKKEPSKLLKYEENLKNDIIETINEMKKKIEDKIESYSIETDNTFKVDDDEILKHILDLYKGKVNKAIEEEKLKEIYNSGKDRYEKEIPPGYKDFKKPEPQRYGDLIIWNEMMSIAKSQGKDILFISDDRKDDWCEKFEGRDLGPRKELIREFFDETQHKFYSLTTSDFIKRISKLKSILDTENLEKQSKIIRDNITSEYAQIDSEEVKQTTSLFEKLGKEKVREILNEQSVDKQTTWLWENLESRKNFEEIGKRVVEENLENLSPNNPIEQIGRLIKEGIVMLNE